MGCTQRHHQLGMDVVALPHCPAFDVLLKIVNPGKNILWRLWRTWPGADQEDCRQEVIEWMAGNLMTTYKVKDFFDATFASWMWWIFLVLIGSIATYTAYLWLVANAPVGLIATYAYVNPIIAVLLGVLFLDEKLSITLLIGAVVVIFGVFLVVKTESKLTIIVS